MKNKNKEEDEVNGKNRDDEESDKGDEEDNEDEEEKESKKRDGEEGEEEDKKKSEEGNDVESRENAEEENKRDDKEERADDNVDNDIEKIPSRRNNRRKNGDQVVPSPVQEDPLNEHVSHAKLRTTFTILAQTMDTQNNQQAIVLANPIVSTTIDRIRDFTRINPLLFFGSKFEEDL
ncbi:uncharacterized protein DDB_G0283697-like [Capsicum annuum]|uniref:uncharacterized protein DDB_G0283697-like n=1 Tax=Capsicum annuum TaxID=4072 RepID=UPI0007BEF3BA|nr:uncharacterized protein DDB_G0283697-like [Capsicum annuum]